ncbi:MAG TPA: hypothetical protein VG052_00430 [Puia sp.]|nr:hypothetical protein [Puia sp.]
MSNERADEFLSWRGRLAPPDALPDQGLDDKELSWERLAERLREKPRRRIGYWIVAACLLLALIPATHFFRDRPARIAARHTSVPRPSALPRSPRRQTATDQNASRRSPATTHFTVPASRPPASRPPVSRPAADPRLTPAAPAVASLPDRQASVTNAILATSPALGTEPIPATTVLSMAAPVPGMSPIALTPPPKKQWKIVYFNEINKSAGPAPGMITRDPGFIHFGTGSTDPGDWASLQNNYPVLKIELSSPSH